MVLWMSMYNVTLHMGGFSTEVLREGWLGFPIAVVFAYIVMFVCKYIVFSVSIL